MCLVLLLFVNCREGVGSVSEIESETDTKKREFHCDITQDISSVDVFEFTAVAYFL